MSFHCIAEIHSERDRILCELEERTKCLSPEQCSYCPPEGGWSIAEILEHVSIVDEQLLQLIIMLLKKCEDAGLLRPPSGIVISVEALVQRARVEKYVTREKYEPTGKATVSEALRSLRHTHQGLAMLQPRLEAIDPAAMSFPHWVFGSLTLGQWLVFIGYHIERHLEQITSISRLPAFPTKK